MRLPEYIWKRSVWKQTRHRRKEVLPMSSGMPLAGIHPSENTGYVMVSAPVEDSTGLLPLLRRILAADSEPVGLMGHMLLPVGTPEQILRARMVALEQECRQYDLEIMQMEVSYHEAVNQPILQITLCGKKNAENGLLTRGHAHAGQDIVMTGLAGLAGVQYLLQQEEKDYPAGTGPVHQRFPEHFIKKVEQWDNSRLPYRERELAGEYGVTAMQAAGEGGVYDALWQLGESTGCGLEVDLYQIPIRQEIIEITEIFERDPYQLEADGVLLMVTDRGAELAERLCSEGISARVIGRIQAGKDRVICYHEERRFLGASRG